jgi:hypothetical protein
VRRGAQRFGVAIVALLVVACSAFGKAEDVAAEGDVPPAAPRDVADGGEEGSGPTSYDSDECLGATFCETFDTGSLADIVKRWGRGGTDGAGELDLVMEDSRRVLVSRLKKNRESRLTHALGEGAPATEIVIRVVVKTASVPNRFELLSIDFHDGSKFLGDISAVAAGGKLIVDEHEVSSTIGNGAWHAIEIRATATRISTVVDGAVVGDHPVDRPKVTASLNLNVGGWDSVSATTTDIFVDFVRVDLKR